MPKRAIRQNLLLERLLHQESEDKEIKDKKIAKAVENLPEFHDAKNILLYSEINGEVGTEVLIEKWANSKNICIPKIAGTKMHAKRIQSTKDLQKGRFGIKEPNGQNDEVAPEYIDLIFVPGIGFDLTGHRIGFGLGYYDRFLKKTNCLKIGLAYEFQIIDNVPGEPHDVPVDMIITEKRIINTKQI
ncbi:MAG: 5-formyltetrahydrofolate cyclo-ligase [Patescibacteria group bacterium]|nr:5-formyltetrahydrofolate cyclo-ligase [Patescibacteria group bacterium]